MSKFIDAIRAEATGRRSVRGNRFSPLRFSIDAVPVPFAPENTEYRIGVSWYVQICGKPEHKQYLLENAICEVRNAVYGDMMESLLRLERAIYEMNEEAMLAEIREIRKEIEGKRRDFDGDSGGL